MKSGQEWAGRMAALNQRSVTIVCQRPAGMAAVTPADGGFAAPAGRQGGGPLGKFVPDEAHLVLGSLKFDGRSSAE